MPFLPFCSLDFMIALALKSIKAGGFYVNNVRIADPGAEIDPEKHILPSNVTVIRLGKFIDCCRLRNSRNFY